MEEKTEACSNCDKLIPVSKHGLHEAYCCRHMRKCEDC